MAGGRLIPHHDQAIVLRTWPFHEADLLVSLFTREQGKVKGIARHAMKSRRRFGGALEPGTHVLAHYAERPREELVRCDSFEILWSPMSEPVDLLRMAGLQLVVEVLEEALPDLATDDNIFRLAVSVLTATERASAIRLSITYFCLWMSRLMGWMPELGRCVVCGTALTDVWWSAAADGVACTDDRRPSSILLTPATVADIRQIFRTGLPELAGELWPRQRTETALRFGLGLLERNLNRRIRSAAMLQSAVKPF